MPATAGGKKPEPEQVPSAMISRAALQIRTLSIVAVPHRCTRIPGCPGSDERALWSPTHAQHSPRGGSRASHHAQPFGPISARPLGQAEYQSLRWLLTGIVELPLFVGSEPALGWLGLLLRLALVLAFAFVTHPLSHLCSSIVMHTAG